MADLIPNGDSSLPAGGNGGSALPAQSNYGSIYGYSSDDALRSVEYYETGTYGGVAGPVVKNHRTQKSGTYTDVFNQYTRMRTEDPKRFKELQQGLYDAGFYAKGKQPSIGNFDANTVDALNSAMSEAVLEGAPVEDIVDERKNKGLGGASAAQVSVTNPDSLKAAIQSVAPDLLGQRAPDDVVSQIVSQYQALENKQNAQDVSGSPVVETAPSGNAWFEEELRKLMPQTVAAEQTGKNLNAFQQVIGGNGSAYSPS